MTYTGTGFAKARIADYRERVMIDGKRRDLRCIRGPLDDARSLMETTLSANPGAVLRYEQVNHGLQEAYYEIVMPLEVA